MLSSPPARRSRTAATAAFPGDRASSAAASTPPTPPRPAAARRTRAHQVRTAADHPAVRFRHRRRRHRHQWRLRRRRPRDRHRRLLVPRPGLGHGVRLCQRDCRSRSAAARVMAGARAAAAAANSLEPAARLLVQPQVRGPHQRRAFRSDQADGMVSSAPSGPALVEAIKRLALLQPGREMLETPPAMKAPPVAIATSAIFPIAVMTCRARRRQNSSATASPLLARRRSRRTVRALRL